MLSLKSIRSANYAFSDLLNYASVIEDGIILNKDGSLMASWSYSGQDLATVSYEERNRLSAIVNSAMVKFGSQWCLHQDSIRIASKKYSDRSESHFSNFVTKLIDEERRTQFEEEDGHFENIYFLTLTYLPEKQTKSQLAEMMFDDDNKATNPAILALNYFKTGINEFIDRISTVIDLKRLKSQEYFDDFGNVHLEDEFLSYLHLILTGENHPIDLPICPMYLDAVIGSHEFYAGVIPKINDKFIQVVAIDGFPSESYQGILSALNQIPCEYRWNTRFIFMDNYDGNAILNTYRRKWEQKVRGFVDQLFHPDQPKGRIDKDALDMVMQVENAISENNSGLVRYGFYTSTIILMHEDRNQLEEYSRMIKRVVNNLHFSARVETINTVEAFLGSLAGHAIYNVRRPLLNTLQLADLLPLSSVWTGSEYAPCPFYPEKSPPLMYGATDGSTPFRFNLHVGDVGHTLIFGKTGGGKSTLLALICAQFCRYKNASVFAFDKGRSLEALTRAVAGNHFDIGNFDNLLSFSPLSQIDDENELAWARDWIEVLVELQGLKVNASHRQYILEALERLKLSPQKTITNLVVNIQNTELKQALKDYTLTGAYGKILDSENDNLDIGKFSVFEIEQLMQQNERLQLPVLLYLFHVIERSLKGQPSILILDEAWLMLSHPVFKEKIREWLKVFRKANCAVVLATQSLSDAVKSGLLDVLTESCPTKIFLSNDEAENDYNKEIYRNMGCNQAEIRLIANLIPKREYYIKTPIGKRKINFAIGKIALAFVAISDKEQLSLVRQYHETHGDDWVLHWLNANNIPYGHLLEKVS